jgi:hypothetical protein
MADLEIINTTIHSGQTVSDPVGIGFKVVVGITMPAAWTVADLTFQVSPAGAPFQSYFQADPAFTVTPTAVKIVAPAANAFINVDSDLFSGVNLLKLVSSVAQAADRVIGLVVRTVSF